MSAPEIPTLKSRAEYLKAVMYEGVTILEGTATWCEKCKQVAPEVAKMVEEYPNACTLTSSDSVLIPRSVMCFHTRCFFARITSASTPPRPATHHTKTCKSAVICTAPPFIIFKSLSTSHTLHRSPTSPQIILTPQHRSNSTPTTSNNATTSRKNSASVKCPHSASSRTEISKRV